MARLSKASMNVSREAAGPGTPNIVLCMDQVYWQLQHFSPEGSSHFSISPWIPSLRPLFSFCSKNIYGLILCAYFISYKRQCITGERAHISKFIASSSAIEALFMLRGLLTVFPLQILRIRQRYSK